MGGYIKTFSSDYFSWNFLWEILCYCDKPSQVLLPGSYLHLCSSPNKVCVKLAGITAVSCTSKHVSVHTMKAYGEAGVWMCFSTDS
jgi:hypothetical protein